jgi:hypothetical protein
MLKPIEVIALQRDITKHIHDYVAGRYRVDMTAKETSVLSCKLFSAIYDYMREIGTPEDQLRVSKE